MEPYPHDDRCGCPICPDCRPGAPCPQCTGSCVVCRGIVPPGPTEIEAEADRLVREAAALVVWSPRVAELFTEVMARVPLVVSSNVPSMLSPIVSSARRRTLHGGDGSFRPSVVTQAEQWARGGESRGGS